MQTSLFSAKRLLAVTQWFPPVCKIWTNCLVGVPTIPPLSKTLNKRHDWNPSMSLCSLARRWDAKSISSLLSQCWGWRIEVMALPLGACCVLESLRGGRFSVGFFPCQHGPWFLSLSISRWCWFCKGPTSWGIGLVFVNIILKGINTYETYCHKLTSWIVIKQKHFALRITQ